MYAAKPVVERKVRTPKLSGVVALAERKKARAAAARAATAAVASAPSAGAAAPSAPAQPGAPRPARLPASVGPFEPAAAVLARAPRSRLWEVDDAVLQADILSVIASGDDVVSLVAESSKAVLRRVLNGAPLRPAEVYRAWCAELGVAHAQRRAIVWRNVFGALPNAACPGAPTSAAHAVKDYCTAFLASYLEAHPEDTQLPPGASGASASAVKQVAAGALQNKVPSDDQPDDGDCPPTPFVARGGLADGGMTTLFGLATDCVLQAHALQAASSRLAEAEAADEAGAHDGDIVMKTSVEALLEDDEVDDDDVVYVKTTTTRHDGVEIMIVD